MDYLTALIEILTPDNTAVYNRKLAKTIGVTEAIIFQALISKFKYYRDRDQLKDGYFFSTIQDLEESTCFSERQQRAAIKRLIDLNLITQKIMNVPARRYFKINTDVDLILGLFSSSDKMSELAPSKRQNQFLQNVRTSSFETSELVPTKCQGKLYKNLNHKLINQSSINQGEIDDDDFINEVHSKFNVNLTLNDVAKLIAANEDLNYWLKAIAAVDSYSKKSKVKIKNLVNYLIGYANKNQVPIEFEHDFEHDTAKSEEQLKQIRAINYANLPKSAPDSFFSKIHQEYHLEKT